MQGFVFFSNLRKVCFHLDTNGGVQMRHGEPKVFVGAWGHRGRYLEMLLNA